MIIIVFFSLLGIALWMIFKMGYKEGFYDATNLKLEDEIKDIENS